jgi:hypothetical protein
VLALADSWDVMTSERPYSRAMRPGEALAECRRCTGSQFVREPVEILVAPTFERTLRIFANEQSARSGDENGLAVDAGRIFTLGCECATPGCAASVHVPAGEYHAVRSHDRRHFVRHGHELSDKRVLIANESWRAAIWHDRPPRRPT